MGFGTTLERGTSPPGPPFGTDASTRNACWPRHNGGRAEADPPHARSGASGQRAWALPRVAPVATTPWRFHRRRPWANDRGGRSCAETPRWFRDGACLHRFGNPRLHGCDLLLGGGAAFIELRQPAMRVGMHLVA